MTISFRGLSHDISRLLLIPAGMALISLPVCILSREWFAIAPMVATALITLALSGLLRFLGKKAEQTSLYRAFTSVALGWALISTVGALPLWLTAIKLGTDATPTVEYFRNGLNALFEGFSGFTSAGLTMVIRPSELPVSLQWWRSLMQWVGGVGVVVLGLALPVFQSASPVLLYTGPGKP
ncbi:MAG: potassium transporter TrkG [Cyanobacteria bacterium P01_H01_bin.21]